MVNFVITSSSYNRRRSEVKRSPLMGTYEEVTKRGLIIIMESYVGRQGTVDRTLSPSPSDAFLLENILMSGLTVDCNFAWGSHWLGGNSDESE